MTHRTLLLALAVEPGRGGLGKLLMRTRKVAPTTFKVRPFPKVRPHIDPCCDVAGKLEGSVFVVSVDGIPYSVPTKEVGFDELGAYAVIPQGRRFLLAGWVLAVVAGRIPREAGGGYGCEVSFIKQPELAQLEVRLAELGMEPAEAMALAQREGTLQLSFGPDGVLDGAYAVQGRGPGWVAAPPEGGI